jgi:hypothetical protein
MESTQQKEQQRWEAMRDEGLKAKKNSVSIGHLLLLLRKLAMCIYTNAVYGSLPALAYCRVIEYCVHLSDVSRQDAVRINGAYVAL